VRGLISCETLTGSFLFADFKALIGSKVGVAMLIDLPDYNS
jgi:hypothetical protein